MKLFIKTFSAALLSALFSIFIYDQYFQSPRENLAEEGTTARLIPANYTVNTSSVAAERTDFITAAAKTIDAVVHVKNTSSSTSNLPSFYRYFYDEDELPERIGTGSGVIVSPDGYIITNNHVIENNNEIDSLAANECNKVYPLYFQ